MNKHIREFTSSGIENVSRRGVLKGMVATGGLVLALTVLPHRPARAAGQKWGADGMPHGTVNNPKVFVSIAPDGIVAIVCHRDGFERLRAHMVTAMISLETHKPVPMPPPLRNAIEAYQQRTARCDDRA